MKIELAIVYGLIAALYALFVVRLMIRKPSAPTSKRKPIIVPPDWFVAVLIAVLTSGCWHEPEPTPRALTPLEQQHYRAIYNVTMRECEKMAPIPQQSCRRSAIAELQRHGMTP